MNNIFLARFQLLVLTSVTFTNTARTSVGHDKTQHGHKDGAWTRQWGMDTTVGHGTTRSRHGTDTPLDTAWYEHDSGTWHDMHRHDGGTWHVRDHTEMVSQESM